MVDVVVVQNEIVFVDLVESLDLVPSQLGEVEVGLGCRVPDSSHSVHPRNRGQGKFHRKEWSKTGQMKEARDSHGVSAIVMSWDTLNTCQP